MTGKTYRLATRDDDLRRIAALEAECERRGKYIDDERGRADKNEARAEHYILKYTEWRKRAETAERVAASQRDSLRSLVEAAEQATSRPYPCPSTSDPDSEPIYIVERLPFERLRTALANLRPEVKDA